MITDCQKYGFSSNDGRYSGEGRWEGMGMPKWVTVLSLMLGIVQTLLGQPAPAVVPVADYDVYATVLNGFVADYRTRMGSSTEPVVLLKEHTEVQTRYGFRVNFNELKPGTWLTHPRLDSLLVDPEWVAFFASIDTSQFTRLKMNQLPKVAGCKAIRWTQTLSDRYFSPASAKRGHYGLTEDYKGYAGIVSFSKVAYSPDGKKAICYYSRASDGLAGSGSLVFFEKKAGRWQLVGSIELWGA
ncbi:hypothetical protein [Fibrella aestuarina]|uniref:hypothetical protein n=1 Tax=Fibrella aestuarina TaxID=651143 RepID=UPI00059CDB36|nr:hypothetical protein [Fibrella aestuarina]